MIATQKLIRVLFFSLVLTIIVSFSAFAQKQKPDFYSSSYQPAAAKAKWTYLIYFAAGNDLGRFMFDNLNEVEETGSTSEVNFVCEAKLQRDNNTKRSYLVDKNGQDVVVRWRLGKDSNPSNLNYFADPRHLTLPYRSTNTASIEEFEQFLRWAVKNYPAERYGIVLNSHGLGWQGMMEDNYFPAGNITASQIAKAIKNTGIRLEVINFDSCLMGTIENAYDVRQVAKYFVGSQANVPGPGDDYRAVAQFLVNNPNADGLQLAKVIVNTFITKYKKSRSSSTRSLLDLSNLDAVIMNTRVLTEAINSSSLTNAELTKCAANTPNFDAYGDFIAFLDCLTRTNDPNLATAALNLINALKSTILAFDYSDGASGFIPTFKTFEGQPVLWSDTGQPELAQGINIYLPVMRIFDISEFGIKSRLERYKNTEFAKATGWASVLSRLVSDQQLKADATIDMKLLCQWSANAANADIDFCILEPIPTSMAYNGTLSPFSKSGTIYGEFSDDNLGPGGSGMEWFRFDTGPLNRDFQIFAVAQTATDINVTLTRAGAGKEDWINLYSTVTNKNRNYGYGNGIVYLGRVRWNGQGWVYAAPGKNGQWVMLTKAPNKPDYISNSNSNSKEQLIPKVVPKSKQLPISVFTHCLQKVLSIII